MSSTTQATEATQAHKLIEAYWTALYTTDAVKQKEILEGILYPSIKVRVLKSEGGVPIMTLNSSQELMGLAQRISSKIEKVISTEKHFKDEASSIRVDFKHTLLLKGPAEKNMQGYQRWTVKIDDNKKMYLDSLEVAERVVEESEKKVSEESNASATVTV